MFSSNGMYLIVFILCIFAGYNLHKAKKKRNKEKETSAEVSEAIGAMRKEIQHQLELANKENEVEQNEKTKLNEEA